MFAWGSSERVIWLDGNPTARYPLCLPRPIDDYAENPAHKYTLLFDHNAKFIDILSVGPPATRVTSTNSHLLAGCLCLHQHCQLLLPGQ